VGANDKEEKFYVDIDLTLEDYGELNLKLALYDENQLNIQIYANSEALRTLVKENVSTLRSALIENEITPREIRIFDAIRSKPTSPYESPQTNINIGFEVKA
jgi:flagellar hook-length control protein FliK